MNGKKFNKSVMHGVSNGGQVLLLLIMILGTLLIVAMTAIFQSTIDTQIGGTTQLSQTTLAAAEAGLEKGLLSGASGTFADLGLTNLSHIDLNNSRVEITAPRYNEFSTPRLEQDSQYTFYLSDYTPPPATLFGTSYALRFQIFYESASTESPCTDTALELTFVYDSNNDGSYETSKRIAYAGDEITVAPSQNVYGNTVPAGTLLNDYQFQCRTTDIDTSTFPNAKFVMIQNYFQGTKLGFKVTNDAQLPPQGRLITSTARAKISNEEFTGAGTPTPVPQTGLTRVTQIFQSYPQIPAEFWTTSF